MPYCMLHVRFKTESMNQTNISSHFNMPNNSPAKLGVKTTMRGKHRSYMWKSTTHTPVHLEPVLDGSIDHFTSPQGASHIAFVCNLNR